MQTLFVILLLVSIGCLVASLIKPSWFKQESRKRPALLFGGATLVFFILTAIVSPSTPQPATVATTATPEVSSPSVATPTPAPVTQPVAAPVATQKKTTPPASAPVQQTKTPTQTTPPQAPLVPTPTPQPQPASAPAPVVQTLAPIELSGSGQQATQKFTLQSGLAVFNMTHNGQQNFIVHLLDSNGNNVAGLANVIGSFNGSQAIHISQSGIYLLNIDADGGWTVDIQQPRPSQASQTTSFSGHGPTATALFSMTSGLHTIAMTHNGQENFIVHLLDSRGNDVEGLANEIGSFNGSKAISAQAGIYLFNIDADGDWTVSIQ